jgi:hypothetical protein
VGVGGYVGVWARVGGLRGDILGNMSQKGILCTDMSKSLRDGYLFVLGSIDKVWVGVGVFFGRVVGVRCPN